MLYHNETVILRPESFVEKFLFLFQAQTCPSLLRTLPVTLWRQRSMTYVWKCKRTYHVVEVEKNVITPPHPSPKISTRAWPRR